MKQKFIYLAAVLFLVTACGDQKTKEEQALEDVLDLIENLPEVIEEEKVEEESMIEVSSDNLTGSLVIKTDDGEIINTHWWGDRSSTTFMDINFSLQACSDGDCTKKLLINIMGDDLFNQTLPMSLTSSMMDDYSGIITFVDADKTEYVTKDGSFNLDVMSETHLKVSFEGEIFKGIGVDGERIMVTIEADFEYDFISTDVREQ